MTSKSSKTISAVCLIAGLTGAANIASAVLLSGDDKTGAGHVSGYLTVHDDETKWSLKVTDLEGEGESAYAKIVIERDNHSDTEIRSSKTDGEGDVVNFTGERNLSRTSAAKVYACVDRDLKSDVCTLIETVDEH